MRHLILITSLWCSGLGVSFAQQIPFIQALEQYEKSSEVKFSYDPALFGQMDRPVDASEELSQFIANAETILPIQFQKVGDSYYTISIVLSEYELNLKDSLAGKVISPPFFFLINSNPVDIRLENNRATFLYKPKLSDKLIAYAPGFEKKAVAVRDLLNQKTLNIPLMTQTYMLSDVLIEDYITKGINMDPTSQKITIEVKDLPLLPGETDGDIFASLAALPGITTPDGRPGNLFIRGNSVDQSLILYDNIPIYHRGHYFGTISPYNQKVVNEVEVFRSGYHPRMGGRVGGAVYINSDDEIANTGRYGVGMNTLYALAYGKAPLANNKVGVIVGARHSYPTSFRSPKLKAITESVFDGTGLSDPNGNVNEDIDVIFQDYQAKIIAQPSDRNQISVSGIYSNSYMGYALSGGIAQGQTESIDFENYGTNAEWQHTFNNEWSALWTNTYGHFTYASKTPTTIALFKSVNNIVDFNSRAEVSKVNKESHALQFGIDYKWQSTELDYHNAQTNSPDELIINHYQSAHTFSPYANAEWFTSNYSIQIGIRGNFYSPNQAFYLSPRISASYNATNWLSLKGSAGRYHQFMSQVRNLEFGTGGFDNELWQLAGANNGNVISGEQYMAGFLANEGQWLLDVEAFYKTANNITYYEDRRLNLTSGYFTANNKIYGIDTYLKRAITPHLSTWVGYSYTGSQIRLDTTNQTTYKSKYIQPHVAYLGSAFHKERWKFSALWKFGSGLNAKSLEIAYAQVIYERAQANRPPGAPRAPDPFVDVPERYPNVHSLDLSASYKIPYTEERKWSASIGLSIINTFDQDNLIDRVFRGDPPPPKFIDRYALGFAPNLMLMFEW